MRKQVCPLKFRVCGHVYLDLIIQASNVVALSLDPLRCCPFDLNCIIFFDFKHIAFLTEGDLRKVNGSSCLDGIIVRLLIMRESSGLRCRS
jgi:hypothetical protein